MTNQTTQRRFIAQLALQSAFLIGPPAEGGHDFVDSQRLVELLFCSRDSKNSFQRWPTIAKEFHGTGPDGCRRRVIYQEKINVDVE